MSNDTQSDYTGGSHDTIGDALDILSQSGWPFVLLVLRGPDDVDVFADTTQQSAKNIQKVLADDLFIEHLKWVSNEAIRPDSGPR